MDKLSMLREIFGNRVEKDHIARIHLRAQLFTEFAAHCLHSRFTCLHMSTERVDTTVRRIKTFGAVLQKDFVVVRQNDAVCQLLSKAGGIFMGSIKGFDMRIIYKDRLWTNNLSRIS